MKRSERAGKFQPKMLRYNVYFILINNEAYMNTYPFRTSEREEEEEEEPDRKIIKLWKYYRRVNIFWLELKVWAPIHEQWGTTDITSCAP